MTLLSLAQYTSPLAQPWRNCSLYIGGCKICPSKSCSRKWVWDLCYVIQSAHMAVPKMANTEILGTNIINLTWLWTHKSKSTTMKFSGCGYSILRYCQGCKTILLGQQNVLAAARLAGGIFTREGDCKAGSISETFWTFANACRAEVTNSVNGWNPRPYAIAKINGST